MWLAYRVWYSKKNAVLPPRHEDSGHAHAVHHELAELHVHLPVNNLARAPFHCLVAARLVNDVLALGLQLHFPQRPPP